MVSSSSVVSALPPKLDTTAGGKSRPDHHLNDSKTKFCNPWTSYRPHKPIQFVDFFYQYQFKAPPVPSLEEIRARIPSQTPTWCIESQDLDKLKATWLGHSCYLVEFPAPEGAGRGPRVIFDPVFSQRCSPNQYVGPKRLIAPPCKVNELPEIDAIVISHNHYDHADTSTLTVLNDLYQPHFFLPLNNEGYAKSIGFPSSRIHLLDWWDSQLLALTLPTNGQSVMTSLEITCTPSQHTSNRGVTDRNKSLWGSWAVEQRPLVANTPGAKVYFGGDTGYATVRNGEDENTVPVNPEFAEIGKVFGGFDLALLPIGAYEPRTMWSNLHVSPSDSVKIFKDLKAKRALAMHWGTWLLTLEPFLRPPEDLSAALEKEGLTEDDFEVPGLGETKVYPVLGF